MRGVLCNWGASVLHNHRSSFIVPARVQHKIARAVDQSVTQLLMTGCCREHSLPGCTTFHVNFRKRTSTRHSSTANKLNNTLTNNAPSNNPSNTPQTRPQSCTQRQPWNCTQRRFEQWPQNHKITTKSKEITRSDIPTAPKTIQATHPATIQVTHPCTAPEPHPATPLVMTL